MSHIPDTWPRSATDTRTPYVAAGVYPEDVGNGIETVTATVPG